MRRVALAFALALASCTRKGELEGPYRSTWGAALFVREGNDVAVAYPRGSMRCTVAGDELACGWVSGDARGKARLKVAGTTLRGTWGRGESEGDGGPWTFVKD